MAEVTSHDWACNLAHSHETHHMGDEKAYKLCTPWTLSLTSIEVTLQAHSNYLKTKLFIEAWMFTLSISLMMTSQNEVWVMRSHILKLKKRGSIGSLLTDWWRYSPRRSIKRRMLILVWCCKKWIVLYIDYKRWCQMATYIKSWARLKQVQP